MATTSKATTYKVTGTGVSSSTRKNIQRTPGGSSTTPLPNASADGDSSILSQNDYREPSAAAVAKLAAQTLTSSGGNAVPDLTDEALQGKQFPPPEILQSLGEYNVRVLDSITLNM